LFSLFQSLSLLLSLQFRFAAAEFRSWPSPRQVGPKAQAGFIPGRDFVENLGSRRIVERSERVDYQSKAVREALFAPKMG
jgi:hypothetical protein